MLSTKKLIYHIVQKLDTVAHRTTIVKYEDVTLNNGACQIAYPTGYDSNDAVIIQPLYLSGGILGWSSVVQPASGGNINVYVRQGTTTPTNGSKIWFRAIFIKA